MPQYSYFEGSKFYEIDPLRCTECVGFYAAPTCKEVCPIDCIKQDPAHIENKEQLLEKFKGLNLIGSFSS